MTTWGAVYSGFGLADCPAGQVRDPDTGACMMMFAQDTIQPCPPGSHTDPVTFQCAPDAPVATAKAGMVGPGPVGWSALIAGAVILAAMIYENTQKKGRR